MQIIALPTVEIRLRHLQSVRGFYLTVHFAKLHSPAACSPDCSVACSALALLPEQALCVIKDRHNTTNVKTTFFMVLMILSTVLYFSLSKLPTNGRTYSGCSVKVESSDNLSSVPLSPNLLHYAQQISASDFSDAIQPYFPK